MYEKSPDNHEPNTENDSCQLLWLQANQAPHLVQFPLLTILLHLIIGEANSEMGNTLFCLNNRYNRAT